MGMITWPELGLVALACLVLGMAVGMRLSDRLWAEHVRQAEEGRTDA